MLVIDSWKKNPYSQHEYVENAAGYLHAVIAGKESVLTWKEEKKTQKDVSCMEETRKVGQLFPIRSILALGQAHISFNVGVQTHSLFPF